MGAPGHLGIVAAEALDAVFNAADPTARSAAREARAAGFVDDLAEVGHAALAHALVAGGEEE